MELYRKDFQKIDETHTRQMVAKAAKSFSSGSNKLSYVHISPVTLEHCSDYNMELNHSGDRCIRLIFFKSYTRSQHKAMLNEIRTLARKRLTETLGNDDSIESLAFREALEYLAN